MRLEGGMREQNGLGVHDEKVVSAVEVQSVKRVLRLAPRLFGAQQAVGLHLGVEVNHVDRGLDECAQLYLAARSEEHTSELQSLMRISYAVFCLKKKIKVDINCRKTAWVANVEG